MIFVRDALAAYRLTRLVVEDKLIDDLRERVWERFPPDESKVGYVITCPHCTSVWVAGALVAAKILFPKASAPILAGLATAGAVSLIQDARAALALVD